MPSKENKNKVRNTVKVTTKKEARKALKERATKEAKQRKVDHRNLVRESPKRMEVKLDPKNAGPTKYGRIGLVNYEGHTDRQLTEDDILKFCTLPPKFKLSTVRDTTSKNLMSINNSLWRLIGNSIIKKLFTDVNEFERASRKVHGLHLDDLVIGLHDYPEVWSKYGDKIFESISKYIENFGRTFRHSGVLLVPVVRRGTKLDNVVIDVISKLWKHLGFPTGKKAENYSTMFRFYVFTSSIPGSSFGDKHEYLTRNMKKLKGKVTLVADDISVKSTILLARELKFRATYDMTSLKSKEGKTLVPSSKEYEVMKKSTWVDNKGSSGYPPLVFCKEMSFAKEQKVLNAYNRSKSPVLFY